MPTQYPAPFPSKTIKSVCPLAICYLIYAILASALIASDILEILHHIKACNPDLIYGSYL